MVVALGILVARAPVAKFQPVEDARLLEQLHRPIDRRDGDLRVDPAGAVVQFLDIRVVLGGLDHAGDDAALVRHAQALGLAARNDAVGHGGLRAGTGIGAGFMTSAGPSPAVFGALGLTATGGRPRVAPRGREVGMPRKDRIDAAGAAGLVGFSLAAGGQPGRHQAGQCRISAGVLRRPALGAGGDLSSMRGCAGGGFRCGLRPARSGRGC